MKKRQFDFVSERMEMSRQYRELTWEEFCLVFDCATKQIAIPQNGTVFRELLKDILKSLAEMAIAIKKINKK